LYQVPTAGYDHVDLNRAVCYGVLVGNNGGANAISVAEHVFMLMLAIYRHLLFHHETVCDATWVNLKHQNLELSGKKLGIIGLGHVGRAVTERANAFGMNVFYYDVKRAPGSYETFQKLTYLSLTELVKQMDIVSLHVPRTTNTIGMINREVLGEMKKDSILINTSRGEVVVESDLLEFLQKKQIRAAGLDVFEQEPLSSGHPLTKLENVVLTPHCGPSYETHKHLGERIVENIRAIYFGYVPPYLANNYENLGAKYE
jgi:phosphoglycerate dehydrogenase-like enzyme